MSGLLDHSSILIYGRKLSGLTIDTSALPGASGVSGKLQSQPATSSSAGLATVYGFEFEGHYYDLAAPTILLVHGDPKTPAEAGASVESSPKLRDDIKVWVYDKADYSMRLDIESGFLQDILLDAALDESNVAAQTSAKRMSGKRVSGKRMSGD